MGIRCNNVIEPLKAQPNYLKSYKCPMEGVSKKKKPQKMKNDRRKSSTKTSSTIQNSSTWDQLSYQPGKDRHSHEMLGCLSQDQGDILDVDDQMLVTCKET